jgi:hypothetical protein
MSWIISHAISAVKSETPQSCHISGIGLAGTWVSNNAGARYGPLAGLALRCCSRSAGPDAPVAEIAM